MEGDIAAYRNHLWNRREALLHRTRLSALYHRDRERFFSRFERWSNVLSMLSGSAAFASLNVPVVAPFALAVVALTSAISVVFALSERARIHAELASHWTSLEAAIERAGQDDLKSEVLSIPSP